MTGPVSIPCGTFRCDKDTVLYAVLSSVKYLLNSGQLRKKSMWNKICKVLEGKWHIMTDAQCEGRRKSFWGFPRGLKNVHDYNKKSGRNLKYYPYDKKSWLSWLKSQTLHVFSGSFKAFHCKWNCNTNKI